MIPCIERFEVTKLQKWEQIRDCHRLGMVPEVGGKAGGRGRGQQRELKGFLR